MTTSRLSLVHNFLQVILYNNRIPHVSTKKIHCNNQFRHDQHDICWLASVSYLAMGRNRAKIVESAYWSSFMASPQTDNVYVEL